MPRYYVNYEAASPKQKAEILADIAPLIEQVQTLQDTQASVKAIIEARAVAIETLAALVRKPENIGLKVDTFGSCCESGLQALEEAKNQIAVWKAANSKKQSKSNQE